MKNSPLDTGLSNVRGCFIEKLFIVWNLLWYYYGNNFVIKRPLLLKIKLTLRGIFNSSRSMLRRVQNNIH